MGCGVEGANVDAGRSMREIMAGSNGEQRNAAASSHFGYHAQPVAAAAARDSHHLHFHSLENRNYNTKNPTT